MGFPLSATSSSAVRTTKGWQGLGILSRNDAVQTGGPHAKSAKDAKVQARIALKHNSPNSE